MIGATVTGCILSVVVGNLILNAPNSETAIWVPSDFGNNYGDKHWNIIQDNSTQAYRFCNVKYKNCISLGKGKVPMDWEVLRMEAFDDKDANQLWNFNKTSGAMTMYNHDEFYWQIPKAAGMQYIYLHRLSNNTKPIPYEIRDQC